MNAITLNGNDTLQLAGRTITCFAQGDYFKLEFPNSTAEVAVGKNGNAAFVENVKGRIGVGTLQILRSTSDDAYFQAMLDAQERDFAASELIQGQYVKRFGNGTGGITHDTQKLRNGVITKRIEAKSNSEGDTEQSVAVYTFLFASAGRNLM